MKILEYLTSKGFKPIRRGSIHQMICPLKSRHIDYKASFTIYEDTDSFFCFGCQTGGKLRYLMQLMGDPVPKELIDITEERVMTTIETKVGKRQRALNIISRIRRMRPWYKNQAKLNKYLRVALGGLNDTHSHGGPSYQIKA